MSGVKIINTIPDAIAKLEKAWKPLAEIEVEVGSMGPGGTPTGPHEDSDLTVADVLAVHEHGVGVPERPVVRHVISEQRKEIGELLRDAAVDCLENNTPAAVAATNVGEVVQRMMVDRLDALATAEPLDEETLEDEERTPGAPPLNVTGQIRESLRHHVRRKRS